MPHDVPVPLSPHVFVENETVQTILDAIQSVIDAAQQLVDAMNKFTPTFYRICRDLFIASMGTASSLIASCILAFEGVKRLLVPMLQEVHDFIKGLRAPAKIKALGTYLIGEPVTTMHELGNSVSAPALSTFHWAGAGADAYRKVAEAHRVAFQDLHDTFKPAAESVQDFGVTSQNTAIKLTAEIGAGLIALIAGLAGLTPPVTPAGAVVSAASAAFIGVIIKSGATAITEQNTAMTELMQGQAARFAAWPRGGGATAAEEAAMADGSVKDDVQEGEDPEWGRV